MVKKISPRAVFEPGTARSMAKLLPAKLSELHFSTRTNSPLNMVTRIKKVVFTKNTASV